MKKPDRVRDDAPSESAPAPAPEEYGSSAYRKLDRVMHPKYGAGTVIKIEGAGDNVKLTILFTTGAKTFLEKYTPLEKA